MKSGIQLIHEATVKTLYEIVTKPIKLPKGKDTK